MTRTQFAEAYEIMIDDRPVKIIAETIYVLEPSGKLRARFPGDQFSRKSEAMNRIGRERRLL